MSGAYASAFAAAYDVPAVVVPPEPEPPGPWAPPFDPGEIETLSRVELEPVLARLECRATDEALESAAEIRAELASRVWQNVNPYADA